MAALPHNNTDIYFIDYDTAGTAHTMAVRAASNSQRITVEQEIGVFLASLAAVVCESTITGFRYQVAHSDFSIELASDLVGSKFGTGSPTVAMKALSLGFVGRSLGGHKARVYVFGWKGGLDNYRITTAENEGLGGCLSALELATASFLAIDGIKPVWKQYGNLNANDHTVKRLRKV